MLHLRIMKLLDFFRESRLSDVDWPALLDNMYIYIYREREISRTIMNYIDMFVFKWVMIDSAKHSVVIPSKTAASLYLSRWSCRVGGGLWHLLEVLDDRHSRRTPCEENYTSDIKWREDFHDFLSTFHHVWKHYRFGSIAIFIKAFHRQLDHLDPERSAGRFRLPRSGLSIPQLFQQLEEPFLSSRTKDQFGTSIEINKKYQKVRKAQHVFAQEFRNCFAMRRTTLRSSV